MAHVYVLARAAAVPTMPPPVRPVAEQRTWVHGWDLATHDLLLAEAGGEVVGFARFTQTWLDDLYVRPGHTGTGVGSALMELLQALRPGGFGLYVFESNSPARAFYARHGLVEVGRSDGSENEERAPDLELAWRRNR